MTRFLMTKSASRKLRVALVLLSVLLLICSLTACVNEETESRMRGHCETVLDALLAGDTEAAYAVLTAAGSREEFDAFCVQVLPMLEGVESYELKQTGWHVYTENGVTDTTLTYLMTCSNGAQYLVEVSESSDTAGLTGFFLNSPQAEMENAAPIALRTVFLVFSLAVLAFCIWMIVDCVRRKVRYKALWIILILVGFSLTVTLGGGNFHLNGTVGLVAATSTITLNAMTAVSVTTVTVPVGAVIYFLLRRRLTTPAVEPEMPADEWAADAEPPAPPQEDENKPQ